MLLHYIKLGTNHELRIKISIQRKCVLSVVVPPGWICLVLSTQNQSCDSECDQLTKAEQRRGHGFDFQGVHELITSALDKNK